MNITSPKKARATQSALVTKITLELPISVEDPASLSKAKATITDLLTAFQHDNPLARGTVTIETLSRMVPVETK